jgi:hypothetical protein
LVEQMRRKSTGTCARAAQPPHLAVLQHAEELGLQVHRHLGDLVEQHRALVGFLEETGLVGGGAGEGALHVAEELGLDEVLGERGAVDLDVGSGGARALGVQRIGRQLLAGAALADDEHVGVRAGHRLQQIEHPAHRRRSRPGARPVPDCSARRRFRSEVSARSRRRSSALLTRVSISAESNGLATK